MENKEKRKFEFKKLTPSDNLKWRAMQKVPDISAKTVELVLGKMLREKKIKK